MIGEYAARKAVQERSNGFSRPIDRSEARRRPVVHRRREFSDSHRKASFHTVWLIFANGSFAPGALLSRRRGAKRARVAVARKLAVIMHRMWVSGSVFETGVDKAKLAAA